MLKDQSSSHFLVPGRVCRGAQNTHVTKITECAETKDNTASEVSESSRPPPQRTDSAAKSKGPMCWWEMQ